MKDNKFLFKLQVVLFLLVFTLSAGAQPPPGDPPQPDGGSGWIGTDSIFFASANADISVFSNNKTIYVVLNGASASKMIITNMYGQTVDKKEITSVQQSSYETELTDGVYIVRILVNGKSIVKKLYLD
jgi:hypothetical protein